MLNTDPGSLGLDGDFIGVVAGEFKDEFYELVVAIIGFIDDDLVDIGKFCFEAVAYQVVNQAANLQILFPPGEGIGADNQDVCQCFLGRGLTHLLGNCEPMCKTFFVLFHLLFPFLNTNQELIRKFSAGEETRPTWNSITINLSFGYTGITIEKDTPKQLKEQVFG
jgi:hypothetical protein